MSNTPTSLTITELAEVLFCSGLQESDRPSPEQVRAAVADRLAACGGEGACAATVAQEAGDHPETYLPRMRWALAAVSEAYRGDLTTAA
ncbi:hypothetical protein FHX41_5984 [Actinomadura hallensis]|uniref:Uncharacterized protein n=1 Tax=Actinomadura hallensis TaxID=337895 RepID=A0A543INN5_9ACTN|nr:hypothetical protein [Actinomadura hallensis]TQM72190.1 hypothetical protein FHX41_5984 [Actinomadura hallensis]HLV73146.1 hypothetical protein [Vulgatibacteraceae bacterium]